MANFFAYDYQRSSHTLKRKSPHIKISAVIYTFKTPIGTQNERRNTLHPTSEDHPQGIYRKEYIPCGKKLPNRHKLHGSPIVNLSKADADRDFEAKENKESNIQF